MDSTFSVLRTRCRTMILGMRGVDEVGQRMPQRFLELRESGVYLVVWEGCVALSLSGLQRGRGWRGRENNRE
jgi:hypothetical protein